MKVEGEERGRGLDCFGNDSMSAVKGNGRCGVPELIVRGGRCGRPCFSDAGVQIEALWCISLETRFIQFIVAGRDFNSILSPRIPFHLSALNIYRCSREGPSSVILLCKALCKILGEPSFRRSLDPRRNLLAWS